MHPDELLPDYVLGTLDPGGRSSVEEHLERCARCRAEVQGLEEVVVRVVEELPPVAPPAHVWQEVAARLETAAADAPSPAPERADGEASRAARPRPAAHPLAIALALVLVATGVLGLRAYQAGRQVAVEARSVAAWLARPDVRHQPLQSRSGESVGSVLVLHDGRAMFVLREPARSGRVYQAWGHADDDLVSLTLSDRPVFVVEAHGYDALYLSLEPPGGNPEPTVPLGWIGL